MNMIDDLRLLVDFGLVILTWLVQLVIYPGFKRYAQSDLLKWHGPYTFRITLVVLPLMVAQLGLYAFSLINRPTMIEVVPFTLVLATWLITFFAAVPLHNRIERNEAMVQTVSRLNKVHSWRTLCWNLIFLIALYRYLMPGVE